MSPLRRSAVAGTWYPSRPAELERAVDDLLSRVHLDDDLPARLRAVVVPHAGLVYSGPVGAFAFAAARKAPYGAIVLVGPSHYSSFRGVSIWPEGAWESPLGLVEVDADLASAIASRSSLITSRADAHAQEHSLEMQLPFLARLMPGTPIVPLVMGRQTRETAEDLGRALASAIGGATGGHAGRPAGDVLLVASSDLSHYLDAREAAALDTVVLEHVESLDPEGLMRALEREPRHACGGGPMVAVLAAARTLGASRARVLRYADSGDVSGDKSSVVGYVAAAVW
jgi:AmmeMemoRadiSam system protein B